jgi:hypothetical protein
MPWSSGWYCYFTVRRPWVQISAQRLTILTVFFGVSQSVQENVGIVPQIRPWSLLFTFFPVHYALIVPSDAV